jgi:PIN domain nuclease of toxin-antitoxin system
VILLDTHVMVWLALLASLPAVRLLALDAGVAVAATRLPEPFHADPADRLLVAQARALAIPLLRADNKIRSYASVRSLWWWRVARWGRREAW